MDLMFSAEDRLPDRQGKSLVFQLGATAIWVDLSGQLCLVFVCAKAGLLSY